MSDRIKYDVAMGTTYFTLIEFVAYSGNVLIQCVENPVFHPNLNATDAEVSSPFMGGSLEKITGITGYDDVYAIKSVILMGTIASFTVVMFVGYVGDVLVTTGSSYTYALLDYGSEGGDEDHVSAIEMVAHTIIYG